MPAAFDITLEQQIAELNAELGIRKNVFRYWVRNGKMRKDTADAKFAALRAALHTLLEMQAARAITDQSPIVSTLLNALAAPRHEEGLPD